MGTATANFRKSLLLAAFLIPWVFILCDCTFGSLISDSAVFRYMGWRYATGSGGYRHVWDCKGPTLILFNALGYWLGISPSVIFAALWSGIVFLFFRFLKRLQVVEPEAWTLSFLLLFQQMEGWMLMNGTETIAAFFSLLAIHCVWDSRSPLRWLAVGAAAGVVFFTKANLISFAAALGLGCAVESFRTRGFLRLTKCFCCSLAGFAAVVVTISVLFWDNGYREMWDATIGYNLLERCAGVKQSYLTFWTHKIFQEEWDLLANTFFFGWLALGTSLVGFGFFKSLCATDDRKSSYLVLTIWLGLEMSMVFCSKGFCSHYTMVSLVPMLALLSLCASDCLLLRRRGLCILSIVCLSFSALCVKNMAAYAKGGGIVTAFVEEVAKVVPQGERVAVFGSHATAEVMNRLHLTTDQKYFSWLFYEKNCFDDRREEHRDEFLRARESCKWLLSERDMGADGLVRVFRVHGIRVFVYQNDSSKPSTSRSISHDEETSDGR